MGVGLARGGALVAALLALAGASQAQVRLDDIFTSATLAGEKPPAVDAAARLDASLRTLAGALAAGDASRVKSETERLLAVLDKADPRYLEALHLRAEAFSRDPDPAQVRALAAEYLRLAPKGERARWFHIQLARHHAGQGLWELAADAWGFAAAAPGPSLSAGEALEATEAMGRAGRAEALRGVLISANWQSWPLDDRQRAEVWLLDSLLVQDDPGGFPVPVQPTTAPALVRYALLMKLRREDGRLARALSALRPLEGSLAPAELEAALALAPSR